MNAPAPPLCDWPKRLSRPLRRVLPGLRLLALIAALIIAAVLPQAPVRAAEPPEIAVLGDSLTAGYGLPETEGLVPTLERWLADRGRPARLLNLGLSGDTTYGGRVRARWVLPASADAVIVELGANDMLVGFDPDGIAANLDDIVQSAKGAADRPVLILGIHALPHRSRPYRQRFDAIWTPLALRNEVLLVPDLIAPLRRIPAPDRKPYLQRDGLHPSQRGVDLIVEAIGPQVIALIDQIEERK